MSKKNNMVPVWSRMSQAGPALFDDHWDKQPRDDHGRWAESGSSSGGQDAGTPTGQTAKEPETYEREELHPKHVPTHIRQASAKWADSLNTDERRAVSDYGYTAFKPLNKALRSGEPITDPSIARMAMHIDNAIQKAPILDEPISSWRYIRSKSQDTPKQISEMLRAAHAAGGVVTMPGVNSASLNPMLDSNTPFLIEFRSRRCAFMGQMAWFKRETEVLHPHNAKYKVVAIHDNATYTPKSLDGTKPLPHLKKVIPTFVLEEVGEPDHWKEKKPAAFGHWEDQQRDNHGRWTEQGVGKGSGTEAGGKAVVFPEVKESWKGGPKMAPAVREAFDWMPESAKRVGSPRVIMSPDGGSAYSMGQIYLDPEQRQTGWLATHFHHEYAHHISKQTGIARSDEFIKALTATAKLAKDVEADHLQPVVKTDDQAISHEIAGDFLRAVRAEQWGSDKDYMKKPGNHPEEAFATAFQAYVHYNAKLWKTFPDMKAFMDKYFNDGAADLPNFRQAKTTGRETVRVDVPDNHPLFQKRNQNDIRSSLHDEKHMPKAVQEAVFKWANSLSPQVRQSIKLYTGSMYRKTNKAARQCPETLDCLDGMAKMVFNDVSEALKTAPRLDKPMHTWRGVGMSDNQKAKAFMDSLVAAHKTGGVVTLPGLNSASSNPFEASRFAKQCMLEIRSREGGFIRDISNLPHEDEIIHPHNAKYKVVGVQENVLYRKERIGGQPQEHLDNQFTTFILEEVDDDATKKATFSGRRLRVYECPYCGGDAYNGIPGKGVLYRGSAKCSRCDQGFAAIGRKPKDKEGPLLHAAEFDWSEDQHPRDDHGRWTTNGRSDPLAPAKPDTDHEPGDTATELRSYPVNDPRHVYDDEETRKLMAVDQHTLPTDLLHRSNAWASDLSTNTFQTVRDYCSKSYTELNRALAAAGGDPDKLPGERGLSSPLDSVRGMYDRMMEAAWMHGPSDPPLTVWRGMHNPAKLEALVQAAEKAQKEDKEIQLPVFASCSMDPLIGIGFSKVGDPDPVILEIRSRSGMSVAGSNLSNWSNELEVIQPPTAKYKVKGVKRVLFSDGKQRRVLQLDEVPPDPKFYEHSWYRNYLEPKNESRFSDFGVAFTWEDQPRDNDGRWSETGGGGTATQEQPAAKAVVGTSGIPASNPLFKRYGPTESLKYLGDDAMPASLRTAADDWCKSLTFEQKAGLKKYTASDFYKINKAVRGNDMSLIDGTLQRSLPHIQDAILSAPKLDKPLTSWRGLNMNNKEKQAAFLASLEAAHSAGDPVTLTGFNSASFKPSMAVSFSESGNVLEIRSKRLSLVTSVAMDPTEGEVLHPHGAKYKVVGIRRNVKVEPYDTTHTMYVLEELDEDPPRLSATQK